VTTCQEPDTVRRFVAGTASRQECREIVRHLLAGCVRCAALLREDLFPAVDRRDLDATLARWIELSRRGPDPEERVCQT
jgi:hypothetical protein